jgi:hypothetical protein
MTKRKRRVLIFAGSVFGIIVLAAAVIVATRDWNKAKAYITAGVSKATGRQFSINGALQIDLGWISRLRASQIQFENAQWSKHRQMAEVGLVDVQIDPWHLFSKFRLVFPTVSVSQAKVILEKNGDGSANWEFRAEPAVSEPVVPEKRTEFPVIEKLVIKDGSLLFNNQETNTQIELKLAQAEAAGFLEAVKLKAEDTYHKLPLTLCLDGGFHQNLSSSNEPYPLRINLGVGKFKANINGNLTEPMAMKRGRRHS